MRDADARRRELLAEVEARSRAVGRSSGTWADTPAARVAREADAEARLHAELALDGRLCRCVGNHVPSGLEAAAGPVDSAGVASTRDASKGGGEGPEGMVLRLDAEGKPEGGAP